MKPALLVLFLALMMCVACSQDPESAFVAPTSPRVAPLPDAAGEIITVTTLDDVTDFSGLQQVSSLPGGDGVVSFREAVTAANNTTGPQTIAFAVPPSSFWLVPGMGMLRLELGAFFLNDSGTTVDFATQTANMGDTNPDGPEIGIYGLEPNGWGIAAIYINGDNCVINGLGCVPQRGYAVKIVGNQNRIIGCQINGPIHAAIAIEGYLGGPVPSGNLVGGATVAEGNSLSSVDIIGPAENNVVIGNSIIGGGVRVQVAPQYGVVVRNNRIGGPTIAERNVISGAGRYGEEGFPVGSQVSVIDADGTIIEGNYIGTTVDGMRAYSPQIGPYGVEVRDSRDTMVRGNLIAGQHVFGTNHYAGKVFGQALLINAVNFDSHRTLVQGNSIGLATDGATVILTRAGIAVSPLTTMHHAFDTTIEANRIAGVQIAGVSVAPLEDGVRISRNSIRDCGAPGIDLLTTAGGSGPTPNDPGDLDSGANRLQNFPVLQFASTTGSSVTIRGTLDSSPSSQFTIECFASTSCDPTGFGEGAVFIGVTAATTDASGHAVFTFSSLSSVAAGSAITATATRDGENDTSEFSACISATAEARVGATSSRGTVNTKPSMR